VLRSRWQDRQPRAREQNTFLKTHSWEEYAVWHLGLTEGPAEETKARYAFLYGDFRRVHRMGLIACHYRAAEWRHKEVEPGLDSSAWGAQVTNRAYESSTRLISLNRPSGRSAATGAG
jgi:hypothetical protein